MSDAGSRRQDFSADTRIKRKRGAKALDYQRKE
jgi:hypothetical protein